MKKYELIQKDIEQKIHRRVYRENERIPSEKELMIKWGVSRITATKALTELTLAGYIYRVQGKGSFVAPFDSHLVPKAFKATHTVSPIMKKAAIILPGHEGSHNSMLIHGILDTLTFPEYFVSTFFVKSRDAENSALAHCKRNGYEGIILFPVDFEFYSEVILDMSMSHFPIVLVDRKFPGINVPTVTTDNLHGSHEAVNHLMSQGHKSIGFIACSSKSEQVSDLRFEGYRDAMLCNGLSVQAYFELKKNIDTVIEKIKDGSITAVLACNSSAASQLYDRCVSENTNIIKNLPIVCFDDPLGLDIDYIDQNSYEMGKVAAQKLKEFTVSGNPPQSTVLTPKLVIKK